jgi:hypothetical protein
MRVIKNLIFYIFNKMDNIIEPNETFDFSKLTLSHPVGIQGGAYFTKIEYNKKPLYIQTTKSLTRQGFVKSGKKYYCDLMFDKNSERLIHWFENLEEKCQKLIFEKKDDWFQGNLEENDIETAFNSLLRVFKSGKYYLLRTNIKNSKDDIPAIKIYNENEIPLGMNDITNETELICILEIQGIKFTSRNFQIDIELKQVMVLDNEPIFENCLIKTNKKHYEDKILGDTIQSENKEFVSINNEIEEIKFEENKYEETKLDEYNNEKKVDDLEKLDEIKELDILHVEPMPEQENMSLNIEFEDLIDDIPENNDLLREINNDDLNLEKTEEFITLKKPNEIYFKLYKEARNKAKLAKKNAILAYLEAKNIKKTYMLENINDSDSDFDAEIEEASESELEGL